MQPTTFEVNFFDQQMAEFSASHAGLGKSEMDGESPDIGSTKKSEFALGIKQEDWLGVFDLEPVERQCCERVSHIRWKMPSPCRESVHRTAGFWNELNPLVAKVSPLGILMTIGSDLNLTQITDEVFGTNFVDPR